MQGEDSAESWETPDVTLQYYTSKESNFVSRLRDSVIDGLGQRIYNPCYDFRTCSSCPPSACSKTTLFRPRSRARGLSSRPRRSAHAPMRPSNWLNQRPKPPWRVLIVRSNKTSPRSVVYYKLVNTPSCVEQLLISSDNKKGMKHSMAHKSRGLTERLIAKV